MLHLCLYNALWYTISVVFIHYVYYIHDKKFMYSTVINKLKYLHDDHWMALCPVVTPCKFLYPSILYMSLFIPKSWDPLYQEIYNYYNNYIKLMRGYMNGYLYNYVMLMWWRTKGFVFAEFACKKVIFVMKFSMTSDCYSVTVKGNSWIKILECPKTKSTKILVWKF